ncbi:uncharacterized protein LOC119109592 isoform X1 [Pollicipes pollicipes]|uniref:uncharacterized protein LOC119109592 isoform X1 n=1 Tax=Pollicipes pollicipes TaxID=41117 RepID=UPI001884F00C|nr:uncharacterized protein LOC119109592 isoform X1 [Pollicipes pollicipes]
MANLQVLCRPSGILKLLQIAICLTCLGLIRQYGLQFGTGGWIVDGSSLDRNMVGVIACGGMVLVTTPLLIALVAGEIAIEKSFLETLFNIVGFIMMVTAGIMAIENYHDKSDNETRDAGLAMGSLAIINAIIYLVDAFVAFRLKRV